MLLQAPEVACPQLTTIEDYLPKGDQNGETEGYGICY